MAHEEPGRPGREVAWGKLDAELKNYSIIHSEKEWGWRYGRACSF